MNVSKYLKIKRHDPILLQKPSFLFSKLSLNVIALLTLQISVKFLLLASLNKISAANKRSCFTIV